MFTWYRGSALTIVYLADVSENGSLVRSKWFQHWWTLQELLATRTILFYTQNWSLYKNLKSSNHKMEVVVPKEHGRRTFEIPVGIVTTYLPFRGHRLFAFWALQYPFTRSLR